MNPVPIDSIVEENILGANEPGPISILSSIDQRNLPDNEPGIQPDSVEDFIAIDQNMCQREAQSVEENIPAISIDSTVNIEPGIQSMDPVSIDSTVNIEPGIQCMNPVSTNPTVEENLPDTNEPSFASAPRSLTQRNIC